MELKIARIPFLGDVFAAVVVVVTLLKLLIISFARHPIEFIYTPTSFARCHSSNRENLLVRISYLEIKLTLHCSGCKWEKKDLENC